MLCLFGLVDDVLGRAVFIREMEMCGGVLLFVSRCFGSDCSVCMCVVLVNGNHSRRSAGQTGGGG